MRYCALAVLAALVVFGAAAGETQAYPLGVEGLKCGSVPPPGIYYRTYQYWYHAPDLQGDGGRDLHLGFDLDAFVSAQRGIWVTDRIKDYLGGGNFGMYALVPLVYQDVKMSRLGVDDERARVGDIIFCPVLLSWNKKRFDLALAYEVYVPTGDRDRDEAGTPGKEYWTHQLTVGATGYLDKERTWSISVLPRYEIHQGRQNAHFQAGDDFHFEWGIGKAFKQGFEVGAVGYCQWQLSADKGRDAFGAHYNRDKVFAAGVEGNYFLKPIKTHLSLRCMKESGAENRPEGWTTCLTLTKRF